VCLKDFRHKSTLDCHLKSHKNSINANC